MSNTIRLKRASGSDPGASDLVTGEVAVRTDNGKLFTKKDDNSVTEIGGGISDVVDDTSPQLGGNLDAGSHNIIFDDSSKLRLGNNNDLEIYHSGSESFIADEGTGGITISSGALSFKNQARDETLATMSVNSSVDLYFNNSKKFETKSDGVLVTGELQATTLDINGNAHIDGTLELTDDLFLADNDEINVGSSNDLKIFHNGTRSKIQNETGDLRICGNDIKLKNYDDDETYITCVDDGAVELYYDNTKKFETTAAGCKISTGVLDFFDNVEARFGSSGDFKIYHNGSDSFIAETGTGQLKISGSAGVHIMKHDHVEVMASFYHDAACEFYYNNVKKIETTASGIGITGNATSSVSSLTDGATITVDFSSATHFTVTLGGNRTFGDPGSTSNAIGSSGSIFIIQDGTGSRTASFHGDYKFAGGTAPTLSTAANAVDRLDYVVRASDNVHCVVTLDVK